MDWLSRQLINQNADLAEQHRFYEKLLLNLDAGVAFINEHLVYHLVNPLFAKLFDRTPEDFVGKPVFSVVPDMSAQLKGIFERVISTGKPFTGRRLPLIYHDRGETHETYWDGTVTPIEGDNGEKLGILILCFNVTDSVHLQEELNRKAAIVEGSFDAIVAANFEGLITGWNHAAEKTYGYTSAEAMGLPLAITVPSDKMQEFTSNVDKIKRGERVRFFLTERLRKSGDRFPVCLAISPIYNSRRKIAGAAAVTRDMSQRLEELIAAAQAIQ